MRSSARIVPSGLVSVITAVTLGAMLLVAPLRASAAGDKDNLGRLMDAMGLPALIAVMREEGMAHAIDLAADRVPEAGQAHWQRRVARIYDVGRMEALVRARFRESYGDADPIPMLEFHTSELGQRLIALELAARKAFRDPQVEAAAAARFREARARNSERFRAIDAYVRANDLVERNVTGALNANLSFMVGLIDGGALNMSQAQAIRNVTANASEIRQSTTEWVYGYVLLAHDPLSVAQIRDYAALAATPEGRAMNAALFDAFGAMYRDLSHAMGRALAAEMATQDI